MRIFLLFTLAITATAASASPGPDCRRFSQAAGANGNAALKLKRFLEVQWDYVMHQWPEFATYAGYPGLDDQWSDNSPEAIENRKKMVTCQLSALAKIPRKGLKGEDAITYDLIERRLKQTKEGHRFPGEWLALSHLDGPHSTVADMMANMPSRTLKNYEDRIARLQKVPVLEFQTEHLLREGLKSKVVPPKILIERVPAQFEKILTAKVEDSPIYAPFKDIRAPVDDVIKADLQRRAAATIKESVYPALQKFRDFVVDEYLPGTRPSTAFSDLPDGRAWYAYVAKTYTTTAMTPEELHALGLREVDRLAAEMDKTRVSTGFKGDREAFHKFLMTDARFFYADTAAMVAGYRDLAKRIDPELPRLFKTLPRMTYGVRPMPEFKNNDSSAGYYLAGNNETGKGAFFELKAGDVKSQPKWLMEALLMHETVPGHHLQIARAQEIEGLPINRRNDFYTAYTEGWALYAESLAQELGFARDPYNRYGQLAHEMWRAVRLVVDTGMHMLGWSREKALTYFRAHIPKSEREAEVEIDRYLSWPGQALAYKVGELKFKELRELSSRELGARFDVRLFHDEVLSHGALPLDVLEKVVREWIAAQKKKK